MNAGGTVTFSNDITGESEWKNDRASPYLGMQVGHNRQDVDIDMNSEFFSLLCERLELGVPVNLWLLL